MNTFENETYDVDGKGEWMLKVHFLMIAGIARRNLALIGQDRTSLGRAFCKQLAE